MWMNGLYIREKESNDFETESIGYIQNTLSRDLFEDELLRLNKILPSVQERIESMVDITDQVMFLLDEPFEVNSEEWNSVNSEEAQQYLFELRNELISMEDFTLSNIEETMRSLLKELDLKPKVGFQATRVSITGTKISPPLFESIYALGRETSIARLAESIEKL